MTEILSCVNVLQTALEHLLDEKKKNLFITRKKYFCDVGKGLLSKLAHSILKGASR